MKDVACNVDILTSDITEYLDLRKNETLLEDSSMTSSLKRSPKEDIDIEAKKCKCDAFRDLVSFAQFKNVKNSLTFSKIAGVTKSNTPP